MINVSLRFQNICNEVVEVGLYGLFFHAAALIVQIIRACLVIILLSFERGISVVRDSIALCVSECEL